MANSSDPTLTLPASEQVSPDGTIAVTGASYTDSFAQSNPGAMYLSISDGSGLLSAFYPGAGGGTTNAPGDGSNTITFQGSYTDVQDIINSLTYVATTANGTDSIAYDIWDQAGAQTTGSIPVTIGSSSGGVTETWTGAVNSNWNTAANWSGNAVPTAGDTAIIAGSTAYVPVLSNATLSDETVIVDQEAQQPGNTLDLDGVTLGAGTIFEIQNPEGNSQNTASINLSGTVTIDAGATIVANDSVVAQALTPVGADPVLVNDGTIDNTIVSFANGGTMINNGVFENQLISAPTLINTGTILADHAGASIIGTVLGGTAEVANGGGLTVDGTLSGTQLNFNGAGNLTLEQSMAFANGAALNNFAPGDEILLSDSAFVTNTTVAFSGNALTLQQGGTAVVSIPFNGTYTLGNFVIEPDGSSPFVFAYAPNNGYSGLIDPDIAAPSQGTVAAGGTLSLGSIAINNTTTFATSVQITAASGTLTMNGAKGSGTDSLSVTGSTAQVNADLASLTYTPDAGTSTDTVRVSSEIDFPSAAASSQRFVPISVTVSTSTGPMLNEPASETVAENGTVAVAGSYTDSFAESNPGSMYLGISDSSGTLYGYYPYASGHAVTGAEAGGSGTNAISFSGSYADVEAILNSLTYVAGGTTGSDAIRFDIWNQAGVETTGSVPVTVTGSSGGTTETWTGAVSSDWNTAANWSGDAVPSAGDTAVIQGGLANMPTLSAGILNGETLVLSQPSSATQADLSLGNVTLGAGTVLRVPTPGSSQQGALLTLTGTLTVNAGAVIAAQSYEALDLESIDQQAALINNGTIDNTFLSVFGPFINNGLFENTSLGGNTINNNGTIAFTNGQGMFEGSVVGGSIDLSNASLYMQDQVTGATINLTGTNELVLQTPTVFADGSVVNGFGANDSILLYPDALMPAMTLAFNGGTLQFVNQGTLADAITMGGSFALGNFQEFQSDDDLPQAVVYAPDGGYSALPPGGYSSTTGVPDIAAPAQASVTQGGTLSLRNITIENNSTFGVTLSAIAQSGTLYLNGATGSGTNEVQLSGSTAQVDADLANLRYVAATGATSDSVEIQAIVDNTTNYPPDANYPPPYVIAARWVPITISGASSGPTLSEPASETVATGGTVAVSGSYSDSFAQSNSGAMYVEAIATGGTLYATGASGNAAPGSGTDSIKWSTDYNDVNAVLSSLKFVAGSNAGSGSIYFEVWNQAGVESSDTVPVSITGGGVGSGPALNEPASETVTAGGTIAVAGSYSDSLAQNNSGLLYLGISDSSGTLTAENAAGQAVAGSGTNHIGLSADYVDVNAILASLHYTAGATPGSDTISFDVWNQAGAETTGATTVTIDAASQGTSMSTADFAPAGSGGAGSVTPSYQTNATATNAMLPDTATQQISMPLVFQPGS